jgi:hypothetical protein
LGGMARRCSDGRVCAEAVTGFLRDAGVAPVTGWSAQVKAWGQGDGALHATPPTDGHSALTDGTYVRVAGAKDPAGDPINESFTWQGHTITADAVGVVAIRFAADGKVVALAAGGLKRLKTDGLEIAMPERADVAFVREAGGKVRGALQGSVGDVPATLLSIGPEWQRLSVPPLLPGTAEAH